MLTDLLAKHSGNLATPVLKEDGPKIPIDIREDAKEVVVYADIPGIDEDEVDIKLTGDMLTISGERCFDHDNEDAEDFVRLERPYGRYERRIELPAGLNTGGMTAKYKRGVLKVRVPKLGVNDR